MNEETYCSSKFDAGTPHIGQVNPSGNSSASWTYPHTLQTKAMLFSPYSICSNISAETPHIGHL